MQFRSPRSSDAETIAAYHHRCWVMGYAGLIEQSVLDRLDVGQWIARWQSLLATDPRQTVVATIDDVPVGHVRVEGAVITNVYVDPSYWGRGIGRELLAIGERLVRDSGHGEGALWTIDGNTRAIALYESAGWRLDGTRERHVSSIGVTIDEVRMVKDLANSN